MSPSTSTSIVSLENSAAESHLIWTRWGSQAGNVFKQQDCWLRMLNDVHAARKGLRSGHRLKSIETKTHGGRMLCLYTSYTHALFCSIAVTFSAAPGFNPLTEVQENPAANMSKDVGSSHGSPWAMHFRSSVWIEVTSSKSEFTQIPNIFYSSLLFMSTIVTVLNLLHCIVLCKPHNIAWNKHASKSAITGSTNFCLTLFFSHPKRGTGRSSEQYLSDNAPSAACAAISNLISESARTKICGEMVIV